MTSGCEALRLNKFLMVRKILEQKISKNPPIELLSSNSFWILLRNWTFFSESFFLYLVHQEEVVWFSLL